MQARAALRPLLFPQCSCIEFSDGTKSERLAASQALIRLSQPSDAQCAPDRKDPVCHQQLLRFCARRRLPHPGEAVPQCYCTQLGAHTRATTLPGLRASRRLVSSRAHHTDCELASSGAALRPPEGCRLLQRYLGASTGHQRRHLTAVCRATLQSPGDHTQSVLPCSQVWTPETSEDGVSLLRTKVIDRTCGSAALCSPRQHAQSA